MRISVSQLRSIIKEEVKRVLVEATGFQIGDMVRPKHDNAEVPLRANPSFRELPMKNASIADHEDVEVLDVATDRGDEYVLVELPSGVQGWALSYNLVPATGPSRKGSIKLYSVDIFTKNPPPGKQKYVRSVNVRATSTSDAQAKFDSKNKLNPGEYMEIGPK